MEHGGDETMGNVKQHLEVAADGLIGPTSRSYWVVEGRLMAGAYPGKKEAGETGGRPEVTQQLLDAGTDVFVNLTEDLPGGGDRLDRYDEHVVGRADIIRLPIRDLDAPTVDHMVDILDAIDGCLAEGRTVYVHCWGGVGRTGTVVGCWLIRHGYATADDVLEMISDLRIGDAGRGPNAGRGETRVSPETPEQVDFVVGWEHGR